MSRHQVLKRHLKKVSRSVYHKLMEPNIPVQKRVAARPIFIPAVVAILLVLVALGIWVYSTKISNIQIQDSADITVPQKTAYPLIRVSKGKIAQINQNFIIVKEKSSQQEKVFINNPDNIPVTVKTILVESKKPATGSAILIGKVLTVAKSSFQQLKKDDQVTITVSKEEDKLVAESIEVLVETTQP